MDVFPFWSAVLQVQLWNGTEIYGSMSGTLM